MYDEISKARHYNEDPSGVETIVIIRHMNFNLGSVVKYVMRAGRKNHNGYGKEMGPQEETDARIKDLKKARYYLDDEIVKLENYRTEQFGPPNEFFADLTDEPDLTDLGSEDADPTFTVFPVDGPKEGVEIDAEELKRLMGGESLQSVLGSRKVDTEQEDGIG